MGSGRSSAGFTLIEMLVVIAIIGILLAGLTYALRSPGEKARIEKTRATIGKIEVALAAYKAEFGEFPPDGYDKPFTMRIKTQDGGFRDVVLKGTSVLVQVLGRPVYNVTKIGTRGEVKRTKVGPFIEWKRDDLIADKGDARTLDDLMDDPLTELLDAFGNPLHYDNLDARLGNQAQDLTNARYAHPNPDVLDGMQHFEDPRKLGGALRGRNPGAYDVWSHGAKVAPEEGATADERRVVLEDDIGNWTGAATTR